MERTGRGLAEGLAGLAWLVVELVLVEGLALPEQALPGRAWLEVEGMLGKRLQFEAGVVLGSSRARRSDSPCTCDHQLLQGSD